MPTAGWPLPRTLRYRDRDIHRSGSETRSATPRAQTFVEVMRENHRCVTFGIATGRRIDSALALMKKRGIPPDV